MKREMRRGLLYFLLFLGGLFSFLICEKLFFPHVGLWLPAITGFFWGMYCRYLYDKVE